MTLSVGFLSAMGAWMWYHGRLTIWCRLNSTLRVVWCILVEKAHKIFVCLKISLYLCKLIWFV